MSKTTIAKMIQSCASCTNYNGKTCDVRRAIHNLKQWPFKDTKCASFNPKYYNITSAHTGAAAPAAKPASKSNFMSIDFWKSKS